ncbi:MAG: hypothetical protein M3276_09630, partial [Actinomycetota bacterium]|nr:hypothetical protein [Actinomycetota bacterium]
YPGPCIWPAPPELNCDDIVHRGFTVLPPDPHGFDLDGDGLGCLSPQERAYRTEATRAGRPAAL